MSDPLILRAVSETDTLHAEIARQAPGWQERAFEQFHPLVHRLLVKSLGPGAEVEEQVNEVFLSFFENAHRIRTASAVRSYMVSITMNRIRSEIRRQKRRALLHRLTGTQDELAHAPGSDDPKAKAALIQLSRIVQELNANERAAFVLRSLERMPILEIAETLGVSESTAKRWARRANEHVRKRVSRNALLADYVTERTASRGSVAASSDEVDS
jgi:RNA polymerase sigma-70 factor, ECF subfamily